MSNIKTGADKLVELVSQKGKVSVDEAAKALGVGKDVVQEWAEFLEEEGLVTLDYNLSRTWIKEKKITKDDVLSSAKEVASEKDAFARRIDATIGALASETVGFEDVRKQFINIQSHIKDEIDTVKKQLSDLEKYDSLKKNLDTDLLKQKQEYDTIVKDAEDKLKGEAEKYNSLKELVEREKKNVESYSQKIDELKKLRTDYERTLNTLKNSLREIDAVVINQKTKLDSSQKEMSNFKEAMENLEKELSERKDSLLNKRITQLRSKQDDFSKQLSSFGVEMRSKTGEFKSYSDVNDKIRKGFEGFFAQTIGTDKLISEIEKDKEDLKKDLELLKNKVLAFNLMTANVNIRTEMKDIEDQLKLYDARRDGIRSKVEKLITLIRGNQKKN